MVKGNQVCKQLCLLNITVIAFSKAHSVCEVLAPSRGQSV